MIVSNLLALCWQMVSLVSSAGTFLFLSRSDARFSSTSVSHPAPPEVSEYSKYHLQDTQITVTKGAVSPSLPSSSPPSCISYSAFPSLLLTMVVVHSTMRQPPPDRDTIQLPTTTAFNICSGLFKMANCLVAELPEAQLRDIRYALDTLGAKVDRLLESGEYDLSLNFDDLTVDPGKPSKSHPNIPALISPSSDIPGSEDFGTVTASISTTANANGLTSLPSPRRPRHGTIRIPVPTATAPTPAPTPTPTPVPSASIPYHGQFPYVISSRENVGIPDYTHHPLFIRLG